MQHLIEARSRDVYDLLVKHDGALYLCGDASHMAKDVEQCLVDKVLLAHGGADGIKDAAGALLYLEGMEKRERFFKDVWTS